MKSINLLVSASLLLSPTLVFAQGDCSNFPRPSQGMFKKTPDGVTVTMVASAAVRFDDVSVVNRARQKAEVDAGNQLVNYIEQELANETKIKEAAQETTSIDGAGVRPSYDEVIETGRALSRMGKAVLRGVVPLDECYTPGKEIRVEVGIKPDTIAGAGRLAGDINKSLNQNPTRKVGSPDGVSSANDGSGNSKGEPTAAQDNRPTQELNRMPGYGGSGARERF